MDIAFMYRLKEALANKGISRSELSRISGVSKGDITHYLNGDYVPKQDKCYMLAKALNVDPGWLMVGSDTLVNEMERRAYKEYIEELEKDGAFDIVDLYMDLSEENKTAAKKYIQYLKSLETK